MLSVYVGGEGNAAVIFICNMYMSFCMDVSQSLGKVTVDLNLPLATDKHPQMSF